MVQRFIRLKEIRPFTEMEQEPSDAYLQRTNGSLSKEKFLTRVDSNGAILTGNNFDEEKDLERIVMIGDSFVEQSFIHENLRFASIVEREFKDKCLVSNYSYSGTTTLQIVLLTLTKIVHLYNPGRTKIIIFLPTSDCDALELDGGYWNKSQRYTPILPGSKSYSVGLNLHLEQVLPIQQSLSAILTSFGFNFVFVATPFVTLQDSSDEKFLHKYFSSIDKASAVVNHRLQIQSIVRDFSIKNNIEYWDLQKDLKGSGKFFYDDRHLNNDGTVRMAELLKDRLGEEI